MMTIADGDVLHLRSFGACPSAGEDGSVSWRGAVLIHTDSETFTDLNGSAMVFHYEVSADGDTNTTTWAWN